MSKIRAPLGSPCHALRQNFRAVVHLLFGGARGFLVLLLLSLLLVRGTWAAPAASQQGRARVLLVGSGRMGRIRARLLHCHPHVKLCGIVDADLAAARQLAGLYCNVPVYESLESAVQDLHRQDDDHPLHDDNADGDRRAVHGCVISTPTSTHGNLIREAARHGLSVFVEKPVAETSDEIDALFECCEQAGVHLCCGFQRRFDPSYVAACRAVQLSRNDDDDNDDDDTATTGTIGRPLYVHVFFADHPVPPRDFLLSSGGNIFVDLLAHDVDYVLNALQDQVVSVYATATASNPDLDAVGVQDCATVLLTTRKGTIITVFLSRGATYGYDQRCEVFGTNGHVRVDNVPEHTAVVSTITGVQHSRLAHSFPERFALAFEKEMDAFIDILVVRSKNPWPVTRAQCVHVQRVTDAALQSSREGRVIALV